jgi:hypothetical protein
MNGYITLEATLDGYSQALKKLRLDALKGVAFLRTWCSRLDALKEAEA